MTPSLRQIIGLLFTIILTTLSAKGVNPGIIDNLRNSTVYIELSDGRSGTGFFIGGQGYIITAAHVVDNVAEENAINIKPINTSTSQSPLPATLVAIDIEKDLAMLRVDTSPEIYLSLAENLPKPLEELMFSGFPYGKNVNHDNVAELEVSLNLCHVSAIRTLDNEVSVLQLDSQLNPGNSGGPVVNEDGHVVGVASSTIRGGGINFAVALPSIRTFLNAPSAIRFIHPTITEQVLKTGLPLRVDTYFMHRSPGKLDVTIKVVPNNQAAQNVTLKETTLGTFIANAQSIKMETDSDDLYLSARIYFKNGAIRTISLPNKQLRVRNTSFQFSQLSKLLFTGNRDVNVITRQGEILQTDASQAWQALKRYSNNIEATNEMHDDDVERIEFQSPQPLRDIQIGIEISLDGHPVSTSTHRLELEQSDKPSINLSHWTGPPVTPTSLAWLWGPSLLDAQEFDLSKHAVSQTLAATNIASISGDIHVRFPKTPETQAKPRTILPQKSAAEEPMPFFFGKRLLFRFQSTRSYGIFDLTVGDFVAYLYIHSDDALIAPLNDKLYILTNGTQLTRLDAETLDVEGKVKLDIDFTVESLWGGLGKAKHLIIVGRAAPDDRRASIHCFDTTRASGQTLLGTDDYARTEGHQFHSMENDTVLITRNGRLDYNYLVKAGLDFETARHEWPEGTRPFPLDWTGRSFIDKTGSIIDSNSGIIRKKDTSFDTTSGFSLTALPYIIGQKSGAANLFKLKNLDFSENQPDSIIKNAHFYEVMGLYRIGTRIHILRGGRELSGNQLAFEVLNIEQ